MNLFSEYQDKIYKSLKILEKEKKILFPEKLRKFNVELPPNNQKGDIACNAAMVLAKVNVNRFKLETSNKMGDIIMADLDG